MIKEALTHIKASGTLIYPTETAYAIGCDAANQKAVDLVFKIKNRPKNKTLPLIAGSLAMVKRYCRMSAAEERLTRRYWPGALSLILKIRRLKDYKIALARGVMAKDGTVAIRVSSHPIAREISRRLGRPIVSTSANLSGEGECYSVEDVKEKIKRLEDYKILIVDGGRLKRRKPSTIVKVERGGKIKVLREGCVSPLERG